MANTLQIKRSAYNGASAPSDSAVIAGEMAIAQSSKRLYIGRENNSGGTVEAYHLPLLTDLTVNTTSFAMTDDAGAANDNGQTLVLAAAVAGDALALTSHVLSVKVDGSSIETNSDALRVKASGVTNAMLGGSIANAKLANSTFTIAGDSGTSAVALGETLTIVGTANEVTAVESGKTVTIGMPDDIVVTGNLTVNGTTTTVNSTAVTIDDPVFTLGGDSAPGSDDSKDRGIEFRWHNGSAAKLGFFGFDRSDSKFKCITDASNSSEVFSGSVGSAVFADVSASTISDATINGGSF
jgi:hypothetical protein|tara:strand:+ start:3902 stop:4789 length:888 start_codon:yes stop_codon:yes gene_type:complete